MLYFVLLKYHLRGTRIIITKQYRYVQNSTGEPGNRTGLNLGVKDRSTCRVPKYDTIDRTNRAVRRSVHSNAQYLRYFFDRYFAALKGPIFFLKKLIIHQLINAWYGTRVPGYMYSYRTSGNLLPVLSVLTYCTSYLLTSTAAVSSNTGKTI